MRPVRMVTFADRLVDALLVYPAQRFWPIRRLLRRAALQIFRRLPDEYDEVREEFLRAGEGTRYASDVRRRIVARFEAIDRGVNITTSPPDGLVLAHALLGVDCPGAVVECGCFTGGSTAKLSIIAALTGRRLVVFDSFEGLPQVEGLDVEDSNIRQGAQLKIEWAPGLYDARLDLVRANVERFGEPSVCRFVRGWFRDTLTAPNLPDEIAFAFTDVDLAPSARDCLIGIWPRLADGGVFFSHDAPFPKVLEVFADPAVWLAARTRPPVVLGAGYGMGDASPFLAMMIKGALTPEHLHRVTLPMYCRTTPHAQHGDARR